MYWAVGPDRPAARQTRFFFVSIIVDGWAVVITPRLILFTSADILFTFYLKK